MRRGARCSGLSEIEAAAPESVEHAFQLEIDRHELEVLGHRVRGSGNSPLLELADGTVEQQPVNEFRLAEKAFGGTQEVNCHIVFEYDGALIETMYGPGCRDAGSRPTLVYAQPAHEVEFRLD